MSNLNIATNMNIMFHVIPPKDDKVMPCTSKKCCKNEGQKYETQNLYWEELYFLRTAIP